MFHNLIEYPIESEKLKWESKIVVRDHNKKAHLFLRVKLTGTNFPIFDSIPFVRIGNQKSKWVVIADDRLSVLAYFEKAPPEGGYIEFGFDDEALLRFPRPYLGSLVLRLDNKRLPKHLQYQEDFFRADIG